MSAYGIQGYHWLSGKTWNYGRRHEGQAIIEEREEAQLQRIQDICQAVRDILMPAWEEAQDVHIFATGVTLLYQWLRTLGVPEALARWQEDDEAAGQTEAGKEHEQVWKRIMDFLTEIVDFCGDDVTDIDEFSQIIEGGLATLKFSLIPRPWIM